MDKTSKPGEIGAGFNKNENQDLTAKICNESEILPKYPLFYLFVQYVWDPRHGPCYDGREYRRLENWLETVEYRRIRENRSLTFRDPEGSMFSIPVKPSSTISYEDFQRKSQKSRDMIILAHIANKLRSWVCLLDGRRRDITDVLKQFLYECQKIPADAPEDQISKIKTLIKSLIDMKVSLYTGGWKEETALFSAAECKNHQILQTIISTLAEMDEHDKFGNTALHTIVDNCVDKEGNHKDGWLDLVRTLLSKGANVNARNNKGETAVHLAAEKFHTEMLRLFVGEGANFNECTNALILENDSKLVYQQSRLIFVYLTHSCRRQTPLHYACKSNLELKNSSKAIETFDFLVSQGCDVEAVDKEGYTPMHFAAEFRCVGIVERLIALDVSVDCRTRKTLLTPLYLAAKGDKIDNMKALLRAGADINAEAADGSTPIFMSAMMGSYESLQFLINQGADLHRRDSLMGFTLLHMAANGVELRPKTKYDCRTKGEQESRKLTKLEVLMDKGFDVNDAGIVGVSPLQLVILSPNFDAVKLLLDRGANANFQNQHTALELALQTCDGKRARVSRNRFYLKTCGGNWEHIRVGVYPEDVKKDDVRLSCPIMKLWSCEKRRYSYRYLETSLTLIAHGANVNVRNASGKTPLHKVAYYTDGLLEKFLDAGAHVDVQDNEGRLPIHNVWQREDAENMKVLLDFGADINDDDVSKILVSKACESRDVVVIHAIKRKLVGLPIAKVYESLIRGPEFADFNEQCSKEAINLKSHRDDDGFSLYEFLRMNPKFQYHFIDKISNSHKNIEQTFPLYAGLIRGACRESAIRRQLLEPARIVWADNSGVNLPSVCVEHILSYLSNRYLKVMTTSSEENKVNSVPDEKVVFNYNITNIPF